MMRSRIVGRVVMWLLGVGMVAAACVALIVYHGGERFEDEMAVVAGHGARRDSERVVAERMEEERAEKERAAALAALARRASVAAAYCKEKGMNGDVCFLVDMSIHSGRHRLFVWSFKEDRVLFSGLCCHGMGGGSTVSRPEYSNVEGSNCTSLGKYRLGIRSYSQWGINVHYKMHGLEAGNSNAYRRYVVLHSHTPMPDGEIYPRYLPLGYSLGCPVVSDNTMRRIDELLKGMNGRKPVLFWIYE